MSRVQKFGRRKGNTDREPQDESAAAMEAEWGVKGSGEDHVPLPSRRQSHPSNKQQMASWFYRLLIALFILLLIGLFWWGRQFE